MAFFVVVRIQSTDDRGTPKICSINIPEWQTRVLSSWRHILAYVHKWEKFAISNANWFWRLWSTITLQLLLYIIQLWIRSSYPTIDRLAFEFEIIIILCCHGIVLIISLSLHRLPRSGTCLGSNTRIYHHQTKVTRTPILVVNGCYCRTCRYFLLTPSPRQSSSNYRLDPTDRSH